MSATNLAVPPVHPAVLEFLRQQPRYSQAHDFIRSCCGGATPPATVEDMVAVRPRVRGPQPFAGDAPCWVFGDGSVLRIWMLGRSHQRPQPCLETEDGDHLIRRWWIWWEARWSSIEHTFSREPCIAFEPVMAQSGSQASPECYRILVNGQRASEMVYDFEIRSWFLEAGRLLPPGGGGWLGWNTTNAHFVAHRRMAHALLAHTAVVGGPKLP